MEYHALTFHCSLPTPLFEELVSASRTCGIKPGAFCAEAIESVLAERRLPSVAQAPLGARIDLEPEVIT